MPKTTAHKDADINAVTTTLAGGTAPNGAYLAILRTVNAKTTGITNADRVAPVNADEVTTAQHAGYARVRLEAATFSAIVNSATAGRRRRTFPAANITWPDIGAGTGYTQVSYAVCNHATNALSTSAVFLPDAEFALVYASGDPGPRTDANSLWIEE